MRQKPSGLVCWDHQEIPAAGFDLKTGIAYCGACLRDIVPCEDRRWFEGADCRERYRPE